MSSHRPKMGSHRDHPAPPMLPAERRREILRRAAVRGVVRVRDLAKDLRVHVMTIRRDLDALAEGGLIERTRGGAQAHPQAAAEVSYQRRAGSNRAAKRRIARRALQYIREGDTIAFDASTTCLTLIEELAGVTITAVVPGLDAANALAAKQVPFILVGGAFHGPARSFSGPLATSQLRRLHPDVTFFSAKGLTVAAGFTDAHLAEVEMKQQLLAAAKRSIALVDHTKIGKVALGSFAGLEDVNVLVTDEELPREFTEALAAAGVTTIVAALDRVDAESSA